MQNRQTCRMLKKVEQAVYRPVAKSPMLYPTTLPVTRLRQPLKPTALPAICVATKLCTDLAICLLHCTSRGVEESREVAPEGNVIKHCAYLVPQQSAELLL